MSSSGDDGLGDESLSRNWIQNVVSGWNFQRRVPSSNQDTVLSCMLSERLRLTLNITFESFLSLEENCEHLFPEIYYLTNEIDGEEVEAESKIGIVREKRGKRHSGRRWFMENGSIFLKKLIADCNGISIPIRSFSSPQILQATNNFDPSFLVWGAWDYKLYKGNIEDKSYMIKRFSEHIVTGGGVGEAYNDMVLSARMSNHRNFLKLFGCCLEFSFPVFVFEYAEHGILNEQGRIMVNGEEAILPWSLRLKIGKEIANSVTYLHMAFPKIIIHIHIKPTNIFLDKNWTAKLSDFSLAITLPEGKSGTEVERVLGTYWYSDPLYFSTEFQVETERSQVYRYVELTARGVRRRD